MRGRGWERARRKGGGGEGASASPPARPAGAPDPPLSPHGEGRRSAPAEGGEGRAAEVAVRAGAGPR